MLSELEKSVKPKVREFCERYLENGGNGTEAALEAGYGDRGTEKGRHVAAQTASRLLRQESVKAYLEGRTKEIYEQIGLSPERVAAELWKLYQRSAEGHVILDKDGEETGIWAYDGKTAMGCLKALGEHLGMFKPQLQLSGNVNNPLQGLSTEDLLRLIAGLEKGEQA